MGFGDFLDICHGDLVVGVRVERDVVLVGVEFVVDEDGAGDEAAALMPVVERGELLVVVFVAEVLFQLVDVGLDAVVAGLAFLVVEVAKTIPLGRALRVELDCIDRSN